MPIGSDGFQEVVTIQEQIEMFDIGQRIATDIDALREQRGSIYGDALHNLGGTGLQWTGLLRQAWQRDDIPVITAELASLMMVSLKLSRLALSPTHQDSRDDAVAYLDISVDCAKRKSST